MSDPTQGPENQPPPAGYAAPDPAQAAAPQQGYYPQQQPAYGQPAVPGAKSRMVAGLLGIFVGGLGIHNFYLGYTNKAIIQIVVTLVTCGFGAIWGLVEGIMILTKSGNFLTDADGVPLTD